MISEEIFVLLQSSVVAHARLVVAVRVLVNSAAGRDLLGSELGAIADLMHLLGGQYTAALRTVTIGGRRASVAVLGGEVLQDIGALSVQSVTKITAHALRLWGSNITVGATVAIAAFGHLIAVPVGDGANKTLTAATIVLEVAVAERGSKCLCRRCDGTLLWGDNARSEA
jgi:hypothetical protein